MSRKRLATGWMGGCSGCHMSLLDLDERLLEVAKLADIVKSPVVDQKEFPEADITLIEGAIANEEHEQEIRNIRKKTGILISLGDCAVTGNVTAIRNQVTREAALERAYIEAPSNINGLIPNEEIAPLLQRVRPVHEVVKVDYYLPGCPPSADLIFYVLNELLNNRKPVLDQTNLKYG